MPAILCTVVIMAVSLIYTFWVFSAPERMKYFNYVMLIPATIALVFCFFETGSLKETFRPILTIPGFESLSFGLLFPVIFLGLLAGLLLLLKPPLLWGWFGRFGTVHWFTVWRLSRVRRVIRCC